MGIDTIPRLHWTQRIALVRHNLHAARRTNDFTFFKTLQAYALIDGTDHVAILHSILSDNADSVLSTLDNLNAGIAYVHQDAFKAVYDGAKSTMYKADNSPSSRRSLLRVDISQQRDMADHAIDKTTNSAIHLIQAQPPHCQDAVANAWITGTTIIADAVSLCLAEMDGVEANMDDFIRLEYSWAAIQTSVDAAVSALRGIFTLMANNTTPPSILTPPQPKTRTWSISSGPSSSSDPTPNMLSTRSRQSSTASALGLIKRAFSHAQTMPPPAPKPPRTGSLSAAQDCSPRGLRLSMSAACPTRMPHFADLAHPHTSLSTIPPTPSVHETPGRDAMSPFQEKNDYFAFGVAKEADEVRGEQGPGADADLMQL